MGRRVLISPTGMTDTPQANAALCPELTIATTAYNEAGNVVPFLSETWGAIQELGVTAEIIYVDDGSTDGTGDAVREFAREHPEVPVRLIPTATRRGIASALKRALALATGQHVCLIPADMESSPRADIPALYLSMDDETDVVVGCRKNRRDGKVFTSQVASLLCRWLFGVRIRDANWIKLVRREKLEGVRLYSSWHRFLIPILADRGCRMKEVVTEWHPRTYGRSKFGVWRIPRSLADMLALKAYLVCRRYPLLCAAGLAAALVIGCALVVRAVLPS